MRFIQLKETDKVELIHLYSHSLDHRVRSRAHGLLLSHKGFTINQIASIVDVDRDTVASWFTRWESYGLAGLGDLPRSGRPGKLGRHGKKNFFAL